jgi:carbamoyltransferase
MNIIGLYGAFNWDCRKKWIHDSGVTLITDGEHRFSISEERLTKRKYEGQFPINSLNYCLSNANIQHKDVDVVVLPTTSHHEFYTQLKSNYIKNLILEIFPNAKLKIISHHKAHAFSSIYSSDFNEGSFIVMDGAGSFFLDYHDNYISVENSSIGYFNKSKKIFRFFPFPQNFNKFGHYYQTWAHQIFCEKINKNINFSDEKYRETFPGKIMGLCAYGKPITFKEKQYLIDSEGIPLVSFKTYGGQFDEEYLNVSPEDKAASIQKIFEDSLLEYFTELKNRNYLENNLCLSGGVFLNILSNTKIQKLFTNLHIPPFTSDCGLHFGAACYELFESNQQIKLPNNISLFGKKYIDDDILKSLKKTNLKYYESKNIFYETAKFLNDNKIIGWFQNRSEFGPRALGSRSILTSAKHKENKDILNLRVKHREEWRPFAGIILEEYIKDYFEEGIKNPYMLYSQTVKKDKVKDIEAISHKDNTCRIQTVNSYIHPEITSLLKEYEKISGIPILLNTSFNDNGNPIVETPSDAINAFLNMDIDYLVIGNYIVYK